MGSLPLHPPDSGIPIPAPPTEAYYPHWADLVGGRRVSLLDLPGKTMCALRVSWPYGAAAEPAGQSGITTVALNSALTGADGERLRQLQRLGADVTAQVTVDATAVTLVTPACSFEAAASLAGEAISRPAHDDDAVAHALTQAAATARDILGRPTVQADQALLAAIHSDQPGFGRHPGGSPSTIATLTPSAVRKHYSHLARPAGAQLHFVGDVTRSHAEQVLARGPLAALLRELALAPPQPTGRRPGPLPQIVLIDQPTYRQSVLACGRLVRLTSPRAVAALEAAVHALAGWYGSRMHMRLRESEGLSYGVSAEVIVRGSRDAYLCEIKMLTAVAPGGESAAVQLMSTELDRLAAGGLTSAELTQATGWMVQSQKLYLQTPDQIAALHAQFVERGLPAEFGRTRPALLMGLDPPEVVAAAAEYLTPGQLILVGAGPAGQLERVLCQWAEGGHVPS